MITRHKRAWPWWAVFAVLFGLEILAHVRLLRLPYFWDEAGYYIPATRDLWQSGSLIPLSAPSNAHPPLVMAYLALCWRIAGSSPLVTRTAMLVVSAFALFGLFKLATRVANRQVAWAAVACTAVYPVFFAQSSMAHVDLAAAGFTFWALDAFAADNAVVCAIWLSLSVLSKETAAIAPAGLAVWSILCPIITGRRPGLICSGRVRAPMLAALTTPFAVLVCWYAYHFIKTGYVFGNPEFFRYNVQATISPLRILLALGMRIWQAFGYLHLFVLTTLTLWLMTQAPISDESFERPRIAIATQCLFAAVALSYISAMAVIGGAVLARYMLPVVPLTILVCVSTVWRRSRHWVALVCGIVAVFVSGLFLNPPYGFALEDNLAYSDYIRMHQHAARYLEAYPPQSRLLTAWPASDELTRPYLGYVTRTFPVVRVEDFSAEQLANASQLQSQYDAALLFSTKYEPRHPLLAGWDWWRNVKEHYFGYHEDLDPDSAARALGGRIVFREGCAGQWVAILRFEKDEQATQVQSNSRSHEMTRMRLDDQPHFFKGR